MGDGSEMAVGVQSQYVKWCGSSEHWSSILTPQFLPLPFFNVPERLQGAVYVQRLPEATHIYDLQEKRERGEGRREMGGGDEIGVVRGNHRGGLDRKRKMIRMGCQKRGLAWTAVDRRRRWMVVTAVQA